MYFICSSFSMGGCCREVHVYGQSSIVVVHMPFCLAGFVCSHAVRILRHGVRLNASKFGSGTRAR